MSANLYRPQLVNFLMSWFLTVQYRLDKSRCRLVKHVVVPISYLIENGFSLVSQLPVTKLTLTRFKPMKIGIREALLRQKRPQFETAG